MHGQVVGRLRGKRTLREARLGSLEALGYTWDGACAARRLAAITQECGLQEAPCAAAECRLFHGTGAHAEQCWPVENTSLWSATACAPGLACSGNICITPCGDEYGCDKEICAPGQVCHYDDIFEGYCHWPGSQGQYCDGFGGPPASPGSSAATWTIPGRGRDPRAMVASSACAARASSATTPRCSAGSAATSGPLRGRRAVSGSVVQGRPVRPAAG